MKHPSYLVIFWMLMFGCGSHQNEYKVVNRTKTITKGNCQIPISFPEISGLVDTGKMTKLNKLLEVFPEHEYYANHCDENSKGRKEVKGDYRILLKNDSLLSIEFQTIISRDHSKTDTIYHSIVINMHASKIEAWAIEPEHIIPNFNRGMIYPYIKKFSDDHQISINLLAYEKGSQYQITWAVSERNFIVYAGGEGEGFGTHKIEIPLDKLK